MVKRTETDVAEILRAELGDLLQGAREDVAAFSTEMASEMAAAAAAGDEATMTHLKAQARLIAGTHRLAVSSAGWSAVEAAVSVLTRAMVAAIALLVLVLPSCVTPGQIVAADIKPAVDAICTDYDAALAGELDLAGLSDTQKRTRRRSSMLLRRLVDAAAVRPEPQPSPVASPTVPASR